MGSVVFVCYNVPVTFVSVCGTAFVSVCGTALCRYFQLLGCATPHHSLVLCAAMETQLDDMQDGCRAAGRIV